MSTHEHHEELLAAYALDALSPGERQAFESHLAECVSCQAALVDLRNVTATLGLLAEPVPPPASLRDRTIARATSAPTVPSRPVEREPQATSVAGGGSKAWWFSLPTAAAIVAAAGMGLYAMSLRAQLESTRGMLTEALERVEALRRDVALARTDTVRLANTLNVLQSGDVIRVDLRGVDSASGATGRAYISQSAGMVFTTDRLPRLAADRSYQLWVVPPGADAAPVSAGVFTVDQAGKFLMEGNLPAGVSTVAAVAVTEEPLGGSIKATTSPLLIGRVVNN
jgi:anti-sigma-K factor RskA